MAIDTVSKRGSAISIGSPWRSRLPIPDGTIGQGDRQHAAFLYSGILAAAPVAAPIVQLMCAAVANRPSINGTFANRQSINGTFTNRPSINGTFELKQC